MLFRSAFPWGKDIGAAADDPAPATTRSRLQQRAARFPWNNAGMEASHTTNAVQGFLDELRARPEAGAPQVVRELLGRSAMRLQLLCSSMLRRSYPRLARPPLNLGPDELLGAVVERLIKALREARPASVREFFGLANRHMRWELNELARRLDEHTPPVEMAEEGVADPAPNDPSLTEHAQRILAALDRLDEDEREVFELVRIQGLTHDEASAVLGIATKTVQRRLNRGRMQLATLLKDLEPPPVAGAESL